MKHHSLADSESGRGFNSLLHQQVTGIMKLLVLLLCCIGSSLGDSQAEGSETSSSSNKLSSSKSTLNSIPSAPAQKTTLIQQSHSVPAQQQQQTHQYVPQFLVQKQIPVSQHQQPAAMFIIAQPSHQTGPQSPLFQQAVQQLLSYYNNNPQAKYQLLQQQGGLHQAPGPQAQATYNHPAMPSGALHVIPSPQLDSQATQQLVSAQHLQNTQHLQNAQHLVPAQHLQNAPQLQNAQHLGNIPSGAIHHTPQATYIIPAQSQQLLSGLNPGLLAQLTGQSPQPQPQHVPIQYAPQQILAQQVPAHFNPGHFFAQQSPQFIQQIPQFAQQLQAGHFTLAPQPQFATGISQAQLQGQLPANFQFGSSGLGQAQFGVKQAGAQSQNVNSNEYSAQTEKSHQASSSSSYNPAYRTAFVKG